MHFQSPLANLSSYSLNEEELKMSSTLLVKNRHLAKAYSEENLSYNPRSRLHENQKFRERPHTTVYNFGPLSILKTSTNGFSNIIIDINYGTKKWIKSISYHSFETFYHFAINKAPQSNITISEGILHSSSIDAPFHTSQRQLADQVFLFLSKLINSDIFFTDKEIGVRLCILLDNDYQTLETSYELQSVLQENKEYRMKLSMSNFSAPILEQQTPISKARPLGTFNDIYQGLCNLKLTEAEVNKRKQVFNILEIIMRSILGCRCFEYGSCLFSTQLPTEPMMISLCLNNTQSKSEWYQVVMGHLCGLSTLDEQEAAIIGLGKYSEHYKSLDINNLAFNSQHSVIRLSLNGMNVIISNNEFQNICLYGFFEEFSINHIAFKEIYFIIRTMMFYELQLYLSKNLDLLLYFDIYLITFVFKAYILALESQNFNMTDHKNLVEVIFSYLDVVNWDNLVDKRYFLIIQKFASSESDEISRAYSNTILKFQTKWDYALSETIKDVDLGPVIPDTLYIHQYSTILKQSMSRLKHFVEIDEQCELKVSLRLEHDLKRYVSVTTTIKINNNSSILDSLSYFSLILFSLLEEKSLLSVIQEILYDKGPLPVGEIGKVLQLLTCNGEFTQSLKEEYGGLKKLLEHYKSRFYLATNHPYNPKVYIVNYLSPKDYIDIEQGKDPSHYLSKVQPLASVQKRQEQGGRIPKKRAIRKKKTVPIVQNSNQVTQSSQKPTKVKVSSPEEVSPPPGLGCFSKSMMDLTEIAELDAGNLASNLVGEVSSKNYLSCSTANLDMESSDSFF